MSDGEVFRIQGLGFFQGAAAFGALAQGFITTA
jgi:hypothetical protein